MEALIRNAKPSPLNLKWLPSNFHGHPEIVTEIYEKDEYLPTLDAIVYKYLSIVKMGHRNVQIHICVN